MPGRAKSSLASHRARMQRGQLRRLRRNLDGDASVVTLPYLFDPELDLDDFERLAGDLERKL